MKSTHLFFRLISGMLMLLGLAATASAQRADDGYRIQQAYYGTARSHVDVTDRLKQLARDDTRFRLGNDTFGVDPSPGQLKTLRIYARNRDRQVRTFEYVEGSIVDGARFDSWQRGDWGRSGGNGGWGGTPYYSAAANNNDRGGRDRDRDRDGNRDQGDYQILQARYGTARSNVDVTDRLRALARTDRTVRITNASFGVDPAPGERKQLRVFTRTSNGQTRTFEAEEGATLDGAQFSGWNSGNWGRGGHDGSWSGVVAPAVVPGAVPGNVVATRPVPRDAPVAAGIPANATSIDGRLVILRAIYGSGNQNADVTARVRENLYLHDRLQMVAANDDLGADPTPGRRKTLTITYTLDGSRPKDISVPEGQIVTLP